MKMRATPRARSASVDMNTSTPSATSTVHSHFTSNENTCATIAEPTSAPSMTASASGSAIRPRAANEASSSVVAVELCRMPVTPMPARKAPMRGARVGRDRAAQRRAERARHAGAHHAHAPEQERDAAEEGGEQFGAGHLWRKTSIAPNQRRGHMTDL